MRVGRRPFLKTVLSAPVLLSACQSREPATPLAHLHGQQWVHGAYEHYAGTYQELQTRSEQQTQDVYRVLAQKGIAALDGLQAREVPFHIRADVASQRFAFHRHVPERLTFTADMSEADRDRAAAAWKKAREHIHQDYDEIHRLDWALTSLLQQLQRIRMTVDRTHEEQFDITAQIGALGQGPPPFALPYEVSSKDYERVLLLLMERLEDDWHRLERVESAIVAVGFTVRATDANSGSLADNVRKVLLSVHEEAAQTMPRPNAFPASNQDALLAKGRALYGKIRTSPEFVAWQKAKAAENLRQIGSVLAVIDSLTGIPASAIFHKAIDIWSGDHDYLSYLQALLRIVPGGGQLSATLDQAVDVTKTVRSGADGLRAISRGDGVSDQVDGVLNMGSRFARSRVERQLVFYQDREEVTKVREALEATELMRGTMPRIPSGG